MRKLFQIVSIFLLANVHVSAQIRDFFESKESKVITEFIDSHAFSLRTDYILNKEDGKYGRNNQDFFSFREGRVFYLNSGYFVGDERLVMPWKYDDSFDEFKSATGIVPEISTVYIRNPGNHSYSVMECDTIFMIDGLGYFKPTDTIEENYLNSSKFDSVKDIHWAYAHRMSSFGDSLKAEEKTFSVSGFNSDKAIISAINLAIPVNDRTISRDVFCFQLTNSQSGIQFSLSGYLSDSSSYHRIQTFESIEVAESVTIEEAKIPMVSITFFHRDGFVLANKSFQINGKSYTTDEFGVLLIPPFERLSINDFEIKIAKEPIEIQVYFDNGHFKPLKKHRTK